MKKVMIKIALLMLMTFVAIIPAGCQKEIKQPEYTIYYTNQAQNKLSEKKYETSNSDVTGLVSELLSEMNKYQKQDDLKVIKPEAVIVEDIVVDESTVNLYFNKNYNDMGNSLQLLYRAGVVKMLTQVEGIKYVQFYVDGVPAEFSDGSIIGIMSEDSFVNDSDEVMGSVEWKNINLYFANKLGDKLIKTDVSVAYSKNIPLEKIIVEKLIKGPTVNTMYATLSSDTKLLGISVDNNVCYVNLDTTFASEMVNVSNEIPIYSIVNSLCELDNIDSVMIMINGDSNKTFRESIKLDEQFTFNDTIISTSTTNK